jgi:hypothetical protein
MPLKNFKAVARTDRDRPMPIASAGFSKETIAALAQAAKRMKDNPPQANSKAEVEELFRKILEQS